MHHHKLSKHFVPHQIEGKQHRAHAISLLALFGYLQILIIFTAGLYLIKLKAPEILGQATYTAAQIINLTNSKRAQNGLGPLSQNAFLDNAASLKAQNMFGEDYWAHNSPSGKTPWSFITSAGYRYLFAGENLARDFNDASSVVDAWMNSPSHRSNLPKAVAKASPAPFAAGQAPSPTPEPLIAVAQEIAPTTEATVLASRRFSIAKIASLVLVGLIFTLFLVEAVVTIKRSDLQLRREVIAHLMLLGFVLIAVWYAVSGAIL